MPAVVTETAIVRELLTLFSGGEWVPVNVTLLRYKMISDTHQFKFTNK